MINLRMNTKELKKKLQDLNYARTGALGEFIFKHIVKVTAAFFLFIFPLNSSAAVSFSTQEECEEKTGQRCSFEMCDYIPPGKTFEEVCGKDFEEGWNPLPYAFRIDSASSANFRDITLKISAPFSQVMLTIQGNGRMLYEALARGEDVVRSEKRLPQDVMQDLLEKIRDVKLLDMRDRPQSADDPQDGSQYSMVIGVKVFQPGIEQKTIFEGNRSVSCYQDGCEPGFMELKNKIFELWGEPVLEIGI